ncbi:MAG TPA: hypothetical protein VMX97_00845 [Hyphomicrobiaceae bacterium]|nr:hypothetical protein [Hyphomicrobiaceae bacterium]
MLIIQAGTPDFIPMMEETTARCEEWGYRYIRFGLDKTADLDGDMPPCTFKPGIIARGLKEAGPGDLCLWLDADAIPVQPLDELTYGLYDVVVTLREPQEIGRTNPITNYLNAGVIGIRCNDAGRAFVARWQQTTPACGNDQLALNRLVGGDWTDHYWRQAYNRDFPTALGAIVRILPAIRWNCWHFPPPVEADVKILHFKRGFRSLNGPDWWRRVLEAQNNGH